MKIKSVICILLFLMLSVSNAKCITPPYKSRELLTQLIKLNDDNISNSLKWQWTDKNNLLYGAVFDGDSIVSPIGTAQFIQTLMCSYVSPVSTWYQSKELLNRMILAANGMITLQHPDGTIDLVNANFHSTPDLG